MLKKIFVSFIVASSFAIPAFACNARLLDSEAETMNFNISLGRKMSASTVKDSLNFLLDIEKVEPKYREPRAFEELSFFLKETVPTNNSNFLSFIGLCQEIYEQEQSLVTKGAVHLLLEKVAKKAQEQFEIQKRHTAAKEQAKREDSNTDLAQMADYFSNIDKSSKSPMRPYAAGYPYKTSCEKPGMGNVRLEPRK